MKTTKQKQSNLQPIQSKAGIRKADRQIVSARIVIETGPLAELNAFAKRKRISRSEACSIALEKIFKAD